MKILYIDVNCKNSSTGQIVYSLFSKCKEHGIEAAVCYGRGRKIKEKNIYKFGIDCETYFHALMTRITGYTGCYSLFSTWRLIRYIKKFQPDVVHIHELHAYFVNVYQLLHFLSKNKIKTVITNHCDFLYTGKCGVAHPCTKFSSGCGHCPKKSDYPKSYLDKTHRMFLKKQKTLLAFDKKALFLTAPSTFMRNRIIASFLKGYECQVVPNSTNTNIFRRKNENFNALLESFNIPKEKKIVLMVASNAMTELKGGNKFLEIAEKMKNTDYYFVMIGGESQTTDNCSILGEITDKDTISSFYNLSYCNLILSSFESFSMISIESQSCGTPVLYFNVGAIKETIVDDGGISVDFNDLDGIISLLNRGCFDDIDRVSLSEDTRIKFSNNQMFQNYMKIYNQLCL